MSPEVKTESELEIAHVLFVVRLEEKLTAFLDLERVARDDSN
jgi:hypothetical protein